MPILVKNEKLRYKPKRPNIIFEHEDLISIKSGISINSNDNDNVSEGYEEIREILLANQNKKQHTKEVNEPVNLNEKKNLPFIKPSSFLQSSSYLTDGSQKSINNYSNSYHSFVSKRLTKNEKNSFPAKVLAEVHTFSFEPLNNSNNKNFKKGMHL
jgi:hypothetical protein